MPAVVDAEVVEVKKEPATYDVAILNSEVDITSRVDEIVIKVKKEIADLELDKLTATEDNKKKIRETRTKLNKDKNQINDDVKAIDAVINKELNELKLQVKTKIIPLYADQDKLLVEKIDTITAEQLKTNTEYSLEYYNSKVKSMPLRLGVRYTDVPWDFNFNSSKKSIRTTCDEHFDNVEKGLIMIETHEFKDQLESLWIKHKFDIKEALFELQQQLTMAEQLMKQRDAAKAESDRLEAERAERQRIAAEKKVEEEAAYQDSLKVEVEEMPVVEDIVEYNFKIELTDAQLERLVEYLTNEDIDFELNE